MTHRILSAPSAESAAAQPHRRVSRSLSFRSIVSGLFAVALVALLTACSHNIYQFPLYNFAGRPIPPSMLAERVMVSITNGGGGSLQILDGLRDIRNNLQNTKPIFAISGFSGNNPTMIQSFPAELRGYVYSNSAPYSITEINYSTESAGGNTGGNIGPSSSFAIAPGFLRVYNAEEQNAQLVLVDNGTGATYGLNLPNVYKVAVNQGDTVALAMVRNSNTLYRIVKLNINSTNPPGAIDCEPNVLPVYCVVPVPGNYDRPIGAVFSLDGSTAYVLNCGAECGGGNNGGSGISLIPQGALNINTIPTSAPYPVPVTQTISIPGGVTTGILDANNFYFAGQQLQPDGLFEGFLTILPLATLTPGKAVPISDGFHSKLLFADGPNNAAGVPQTTLWIGSQNCSNGERAKLGLNYNCLTRVLLDGTTTPAAAVVPLNVVAGGKTPVPYPNQNGDQFYYGSLTGICWVQNYFKVYTAYGGQVHIFSTLDGSEINNSQVTVTGTALDVAYLDALTDQAN